MTGPIPDLREVLGKLGLDEEAVLIAEARRHGIQAKTTDATSPEKMRVLRGVLPILDGLERLTGRVCQ